jgi:hypothetical protein
MTILVRYTHGGQLKKFTFFHFFVSQKGVYLVHKSVIGGHILVHQSQWKCFTPFSTPKIQGFKGYFIGGSLLCKFLKIIHLDEKKIWKLHGNFVYLYMKIDEEMTSI